jgi:hypothetical protein
VCPRNQVLESLTRQYVKKKLSKLNIVYTIGKLLKHGYLNNLAFSIWGYELNVTIKKRVKGQIFKSVFP